jgi:nucleotide-binding universal stress UspA family protein
MYPWRRILIPTDFSTASQWAFDDAIHLAASTGAELIILHIRMTRTSRPGELRFPADPQLYEYAEQHELDMLRERVKSAHANVAARLVVRQAPHAGTEICRTAKDEDVDLIVISTHARHHIAHFIIGSTTMSVMHTPPAPVVAVRYGIRRRHGSLKRLVVPLHFDQSCEAAATLAAEIARREQSAVHLVTLVKKVDVDRANAMQADAIARLFEGINVSGAVIVAGDVEGELVKYCAEHDADMLVVNAGDAVGDVKKEIVRNAGLPVMMVPENNA